MTLTEEGNSASTGNGIIGTDTGAVATSGGTCIAIFAARDDWASALLQIKTVFNTKKCRMRMQLFNRHSIWHKNLLDSSRCHTQ